MDFLQTMIGTFLIFFTKLTLKQNDLCDQFEDKRLSMNSKIIMLHNFKEFMPSKAINDTLEYEVSELENLKHQELLLKHFSNPG